MKKLLLCLILLSPFLVCDPYPGADYFTVKGLPSSINTTNIPPDSTGKYAFMLDLATLPAGVYTVTANACTNAEGCSADSLPFGFTRHDLSKPLINFKFQK